VSDQPPKESEAQVRVVDRRWWARKDGDSEQPDDRGARKPSYVEDLERQLAEQGAQLQAFTADHRRALDEFEQARLRFRRDVAREVERGKRFILVELLEVLDNLDRAISAARSGTSPTSGSNEALDNLTRGVELVRDQFLGKLGAWGVERVTALGVPFDAARHEAVTTTPVEAEQDGLIVAVMKEGYAIGEEILRPASVVVGKATS
jgi:molecular chaperone GrpE